MAECGLPKISDIFTLMGILGGGRFGIAYLIKHQDFGEIVFKKIEVSESDDLQKDRFHHESNIHKHLHHPNIVHFFGVYSVETTCGIFMEYMKYGDVTDFIKEFDVTWQWRTKIVYDVAQAMVYLHSQHPCIIHGDLKPQNILIDGQYCAKISDFGLACFQITIQSPDGISCFGTLPYIAPEYLKNHGRQKTVKFDVYGFAISVWEIYSGQRHSDDFQDASTTRQFVIDGRRPLIEDITTLHRIPAEILYSVEQCWHKLEQNRPSFVEIIGILLNELSQIGEALQVPMKNINQEPLPTENSIPKRSHSSGGNNTNTSVIAIQGIETGINTNEDRDKFIKGFNKVGLSLLTYLDSENGLLECLTFHDVLTDSEYNVLVSISPNKQRNGRLLQQFIKPKINEKCKGFVDALIANDQEHIATHIMSSGLNQNEDRLLTCEEIKIVDNNMFGLINLIQPYKMQFLYRLVSKNCITSTHKEKIESQEEFSKKVDELLTILKRRRYKDLRNFKQCLHDTMQNKIVELFEKSGLIAIRVKLVSRPDKRFIESALIAHMTDYVDGNIRNTLTAEQMQFLDNLLQELEKFDIHLLGTSAWHSMAVFFTTISLQMIEKKFESGKLKQILEKIYRVFYKLPECAPDLIDNISLHEQPSQRFKSTRCSTTFSHDSGGKFKKCPGCSTWCSRAECTIACVECPYCTHMAGRSKSFCWICLQPWRGQPEGSRCGNPTCYETTNDTDNDHPFRISPGYSTSPMHTYFRTETKHGPGNWHLNSAFNEAVRSFHDRNARQPIGKIWFWPKKCLRISKRTSENSWTVEAYLSGYDMNYRGSSYEGVKVRKNATDEDLEFDIAYFLDGGIDLQAIILSNNPKFAWLKPKPGMETRIVFQETTVNGVLSGEKVRVMFFRQLVECNFPNVQFRQHGPAIQLDVFRDGKKFFSVNLIPHFDLGSGTCYVPKPMKNGQHPEAWCRSYALDEKKRFDEIDHDNGCRKMVLRILKVLRHRSSELAVLQSVQLKTVLLREVDSQPSWKQNELGERLMDVMWRLEREFSAKHMNYYFNSNVNLLENMIPSTMENIAFRINRLRRNRNEMMAILAQ